VAARPATLPLRDIMDIALTTRAKILICVLPSWPQQAALELAPKHWAAT